MLFYIEKRSLRSRFLAVQGGVSKSSSCILEVVKEKGRGCLARVDGGLVSLVGDLPAK
jgi:hypothetical protein